jgi:hypothetical protein
MHNMAWVAAISGLFVVCGKFAAGVMHRLTGTAVQA